MNKAKQNNTKNTSEIQPPPHCPPTKAIIMLAVLRLHQGKGRVKEKGLNVGSICLVRET